MTSRQDTSELIRDLAREVTQRNPSNGIRFGHRLLISAVCSLLLSIALALGIFGIRPGLLFVIAGKPFVFKFLSMLLLTVGSIALARRDGEPGAGRFAWAALIPALIVITFGLAFDGSGFPLFGRQDSAVPNCVGAIVLLSLPSLAIGLRVLKSGIPVQPTRAGLSAGFLAGTIGGTAYTFACKNDGALFVVVWYGLAIVVVTLIGGALGRRFLAW